MRQKVAAWRAANLEKSKAAKRASYHSDIEGSRAKDKARYHREADRRKAAAKRWYDANKATVLARAKTPEGRVAARLRENQKRKNPHYRLHSAIGRGIRAALKSRKAGQKWEHLVGYSVSDLVAHLERQFQPGMTWQNYGKWHVDHIVPRIVFSYTSPDDPAFAQCWALSNLQPLWAADNIRKHASLPAP